MISVIVCTFNRSELVCECIRSLLQQTERKELYEIVVVDNASADDTAARVKDMASQHNTIKYLYEEKIGLSHARNAGYKAAQFDWISYIDDDALAHKDYIEQIRRTIENYGWDCFGGVFNRWFKYGRPKWYPAQFGTNRFDFDKTDLLPNNKYACGGVLTLRKSVLTTLNGFKSEFGMTGNTVAYGEETDLQLRMREKGYTIGFNPAIQIDHLVAKYKLSVRWHLAAFWKSARSVAQIRGKAAYPFSETLKYIIIASIRRLKYLMYLSRKDYYWQNFILDYSEPIIRKLSAIHYLYIRKNNV